ncbi:rhombotin-1 [Trichonephila inaurata madagascariensis]|uniref:Rhombotin-1 n=1 Tax=Trichonephila inaurata madagascariensis TaxID=2747483 RepID=A0A8X6YBN2_9ARAC|nr:rhombotin-1 [Trichonephila inaurata madagascariensis]
MDEAERLTLSVAGLVGCINANCSWLACLFGRINRRRERLACRKALLNLGRGRLLAFCVGDRFYLHDNKIICEYDHEERALFATLPFTCAGLAQLKRQAQQITETGVRDDGSSGYGSGDSPYDGR